MILRRQIHHQGRSALPTLAAALADHAAVVARVLEEPPEPKKRVRRTRKEPA